MPAGSGCSCGVIGHLINDPAPASSLDIGVAATALAEGRVVDARQAEVEQREPVTRCYANDALRVVDHDEPD
jgi:hypothetical protein